MPERCLELSLRASANWRCELHRLTSVYNQSLWGGASLQRKRIIRHLQMLRSDDSLLTTSEIMHAPKSNVALLEQACTERGMCVYANQSCGEHRAPRDA